VIKVRRPHHRPRPEGGDEGGYVVATGTPEDVAENPESYTGKFLQKMLERA